MQASGKTGVAEEWWSRCSLPIRSTAGSSQASASCGPGVPAAGFGFTGADILLVPFSFVWCGFAVFWTVMAGRAGGLFQLGGLMFVAIGLYFVAGRFFVDAWIRRGVAYALTDRRVLISRPKPFSDLHRGRPGPPARRPGAGSAERARRDPVRPAGDALRRARDVDLVALARPHAQFIDIEDVRKVFDLVQQAASRR